MPMPNNLIPPPDHLPLAQILPARPLLLMGAGPVPVPAAVAAANGVVINHLGPTMNQVIERVRLMASYAFQTTSDKIIGVGGPASAAMEMAIASVAGPGTAILVLKNGTFSGRFGEMAQGLGADVTFLESVDNGPFTATTVRSALAAKKYQAVAIAQGETSCGLWNTHLAEIAQVCKEYEALIIVDAVCTLTTMPLAMDAWQLDIVVTGGQKGLSSIPGVSLLAFSEPAWQLAMGRSGPFPHWVLDVRRAARFWLHHEYHYTAPVPGILALHEALRLICLETLPRRFQRHLQCSLALQAALATFGILPFTPQGHRLNSVVALTLPPAIDPNKFRHHLATAEGVEISGSFGLPIIRIGQMGEQCRSKNLHTLISAIAATLKFLQHPVELLPALKMIESL